MHDELFQEITSRYEDLLEQVAEENHVDPSLLRTLIEYESEKVHLEKRRGAKDSIRKIIEDYLEKEEA